MDYIIDRFEGDFAVCQNFSTSKFQNIKKSDIPKNAKEGDIITFENNIFLIDEAKNQKRQNEINSKFNSIWN